MKEKRIQEKDILKSKKFYSFKEAITRFASITLVSIMMLGASLGLVGCGNEVNNPSNGISSSTVTSSTISTNPSQGDTTHSSTIQGGSDQSQDSTAGSENKDNTVDSTTNSGDNENVTPDNPPATDEGTTFEEFLQEHDAVAKEFAQKQIEGISYIENSLSTTYKYLENEGKIEGIAVANVVKTGETTRELKIATINFSQPVDIDEIIAGEAQPLPIITSESVLSFDAKEEYNNPDSSIEKQIADAITENLGEDAVETTPYEKENYTAKTVSELVQSNPALVNEILNEKCFDGITARCIVIGFNASNIETAKWYLGGDNEITSIKFLFKHYSSQTAFSYHFGEAKLAHAISIDDFINRKNIEISGYTQHYMQTFATNEQGTHDELMNAICKTAGLGEKCPEGAVRLFKDAGGTIVDGIGETRGFVVVQITENDIQQVAATIRYSRSDLEYIANLQDKSKYVLSKITKQDIIGSKVDYERLSRLKTTNLCSVPVRKKENDAIFQNIKNIQ